MSTDGAPCPSLQSASLAGHRPAYRSFQRGGARPVVHQRRRAPPLTRWGSLGPEHGVDDRPLTGMASYAILMYRQGVPAHFWLLLAVRPKPWVIPPGSAPVVQTWSVRTVWPLLTLLVFMCWYPTVVQDGSWTTCSSSRGTPTDVRPPMIHRPTTDDPPTDPDDPRGDMLCTPVGPPCCTSLGHWSIPTELLNPWYFGTFRHKTLFNPRGSAPVVQSWSMLARLVIYARLTNNVRLTNNGHTDVKPRVNPPGPAELARRTLFYPWYRGWTSVGPAPFRTFRWE